MSQVDIANLPAEFEVFVGGCFGPTFTARLIDGKLMYESSPGVYSLISPVEINPGPEKWSRFWEKTDEIGVWGWASSYDNPAVDGTHWRVHIVYGDRAVTSEGSNAYPNEDETGNSKDFEQFLAVLRELLGGADFW